ncbi:MAG: winged helix-turn-helix transcriptional regulator, partial [Thermoplasmatota archaeon]
PGIHRNALERETGLKSGTLRHHLDILTSKGKLVSQKKGGFACYVLPEHYQQLASAGAVKSDGAKAILDVITENPGTNARNVAQQLGLSPGTVAYHVKRLQQAGMVQSVREGRQTLLHVVSMPYPAA